MDSTFQPDPLECEDWPDRGDEQEDGGQQEERAARADQALQGGHRAGEGWSSIWGSLV